MTNPPPLRAPYTLFNTTRMCPVVVYKNGVRSDDTEWDCELWVERGEDWYALSSLKDKRVRVIERTVFLRSPIISGETRR